MDKNREDYFRKEEKYVKGNNVGKRMGTVLCDWIKDVKRGVPRDKSWS